MTSDRWSARHRGRVVAEATHLGNTLAWFDLVPPEVVIPRSHAFTGIYLWDGFSERVFELWPNRRAVVDSGEKVIYVNRLPDGVRALVRVLPLAEDAP